MIEKALRERLRQAQRRRVEARAQPDAGAEILAAFECGKAHFELGGVDLPFALRLLSDAIGQIEAEGCHRELLPELLGMTGRCHQRMKQGDHALAWYRRAAQEAHDQGLAAEAIRWFGKEATTRWDSGDSDRGRELLEKAVEYGRAHHAAGQPVAEALAIQVQRLADLPTTSTEIADTLWDESDRLVATLPIGQVHFTSAINRAMTYGKRDALRIAETYLEEAEEIGSAIHVADADMRDLALRTAGLLRRKGDPVGAGKRLLGYLPKCDDDAGRYEVLAEAVACFYEGSAWEAMRLACDRLRNLSIDAAPRSRFEVEMLGAIACRGSRRFDDALSYVRVATELAESSGASDALCSAWGQTSLILLDKGDFTESALLTERLWAFGDRNPLTAAILVRALIGKDDLRRADQVASEFAQIGGDTVAAARLRALLAEAGSGDPRSAWEAFCHVAGRDLAAQAEGLTRLIALAPPRSTERFQLARQRLRLMDFVRNAVSDVFSDDSWRAVTGVADEFPAWLDDFVAEALVGRHDRAAIFELERYRAQALVNLLAERATLWGYREQDRGRFKSELTARVQRERYRFEALTSHKKGWREKRAVAEKERQLATMALSAEGLIHIGPENIGWQFPQDLRELLGRHRLGEGECLLFAHPLPDRLAFWSKPAKGRIARIALPGLGRAEIDRMGRMLRTIGGDGVPPDLNVLLADLDTLCGKPLASWLRRHGVRRAFLSGGTSLAALPIDCCASFLESGAPELILLPTAAALGFTRSVRRPIPDRLYLVTRADRDQFGAQQMGAARGLMRVVVDPSRDLEFAPLEAASVASAAGGTLAVEIIDQAGLDPSSAARACSGIEVLHFAGHGDFDDASPFRSGVAIGPLGDPGAIWTNADIFSDVEAPAGRLAVLSGCETGQTRPNLVSEEVSLPAAFIAAGFAAIVASRWAADDLSSTLLMAEFYRRWSAGGVSVAGALAQSRSWLRDLSSTQVRTLVASMVDRAVESTPSRADALQSLYKTTLALLEEESAFPFANPVYWCAFFVAGDGAITSDGEDVRVPRFTGRFQDAIATG